VRYFLDTEFNGFDGQLIAIALVPESPAAQPFYAVLPCPAPTAWVADHVIPRLGAAPQPRETVVTALSAYLLADAQPVLVADWPEDIAHAASLLAFRGRRIVPDVQFHLLSLPGFDTASASRLPHNALADAMALRDAVLGREGGCSSDGLPAISSSPSDSHS
jgi:hypothetical protein